MIDEAQQRVRIAIDAARTAGSVLLSRWGRRGDGLATKTTSTDVVLDADRAAEAEIVRILRRRYPDDSIIAEEGSGEGERTSGHRWYVDPLDGTVNYLYGIPHFAVAIACEDARGLVAAVVYDPSRDELFTAARGNGAWLRSERLGVSTADDLASSLVATGFAYVAEARAEQARILTGVLSHVRDIRRLGSAQLDLAYVAASRYDAYWESVDKPWDWKAGALLVAEAGGRVTELTQARAGHPHIVASAPLIHDDLVRLLAGAVHSA
ncbi:MAG TPA: inositol monophosphatase family protein [Candidatus Limnocylindrales bacterium]|nr:inositol monophosphatase family protein [Candidatus Limnocylindrales bacterium]